MHTARPEATQRKPTLSKQCCWVLVCFCVCLSACLSACLSVRVSDCLFACLFVCLCFCLSVCMSVRSSVRPSVCLFLCLSVCLSVCLSSVSFRFLKLIRKAWGNALIKIAPTRKKFVIKNKPYDDKLVMHVFPVVRRCMIWALKLFEPGAKCWRVLRTPPPLSFLERGVPQVLDSSRLHLF